ARAPHGSDPPDPARRSARGRRRFLAAVEPDRVGARFARGHPVDARDRGGHGRLGRRESAHPREPRDGRDAGRVDLRVCRSRANVCGIPRMSGEPAKKTSAHPARIPLTGADAFLLAFDAETRRRNRANHLSQVVLRLGPGFSPDEFARVLGQVVDANPILRAPIRRRGVVGHAEYRLDLAARAAGPVFELHETDAPPPGDWNAPVELPELFAERLNELHPGGRAGLLRADAVRYADGRTDLALTWLHMLFDGWGSERFVEFLEECRSGARTPDAV